MLYREIYIREGDELIPAPKNYHGYSKDDRMILSNALRQIVEVASQTLGHAVRLLAASVPSDLDSIAKNHALAALTGADKAPELSDTWQMPGFLNTARLAYGLDTPESLGHPPGFDLMHGPLNLVVYIDYNGYSLDFRVGDVTELGVDMLDDEDNYASHPELGLWKMDPVDSQVCASCWPIMHVQSLTNITISLKSRKLSRISSQI